MPPQLLRTVLTVSKIHGKSRITCPSFSSSDILSQPMLTAPAFRADGCCPTNHSGYKLPAP
eukprot:763660-Hanusia_phi.AAC.1